ncbi:MAG TPA: RsmE family RNA methyltransferase, partial [Saprospiraceae bacterium]|nr:RsmE family RNA methyltransferase [Saprospiraceae bacterium]
DCQFGERTHLRMDRIRKVTIAAAKQSRKLTLPELQDFISPKELVTKSKIRNPMLRPASSHPDATAQQPSKILYCHLDETARPLHHTYQGEEDVLVLVGPEGGFSDQETDLMKSIGALATSLGSFRLRVETAVIAACANIHQLYALKSAL